MADSAATGGDRRRRLARRIVVIGFVVLQGGFVVRAYSAPHKEFGFQMFPEASTWRADIVRVVDDGRRVSIDEPWNGYTWNELAGVRGLGSPWLEHHADAGLDNQLAFLGEALEWIGDNTPDDTETRYFEAEITTSLNGRAPAVTVIRSAERTRP